MAAEKANIFGETVEHFLAPILPLMRDPEVAEIMPLVPVRQTQAGRCRGPSWR